MERLWTPWRFEYVSRSKDSSRPGVPDALNAWPGPAGGGHDCVFCNMIAAVDHAIAQGMPAADAERAAHILFRGPGEDGARQRRAGGVLSNDR